MKDSSAAIESGIRPAAGPFWNHVIDRSSCSCQLIVVKSIMQMGAGWGACERAEGLAGQLPFGHRLSGGIEEETEDCMRHIPKRESSRLPWHCAKCTQVQHSRWRFLGCSPLRASSLVQSFSINFSYGKFEAAAAPQVAKPTVRILNRWTYDKMHY